MIINEIRDELFFKICAYETLNENFISGLLNTHAADNNCGISAAHNPPADKVTCAE
jgi:hypothetical protein